MHHILHHHIVIAAAIVGLSVAGVLIASHSSHTQYPTPTIVTLHSIYHEPIPPTFVLAK